MAGFTIGQALIDKIGQAFQKGVAEVAGHDGTVIRTRRVRADWMTG